MALWKVNIDGRSHWAVGAVAAGPKRLLPDDVTLDQLLDEDSDFLSYRALPTRPIGDECRLSTPLDGQEVWASGVTFIESRYAREQESTSPDFYRDVYFADRPELFPKATPGTVVGTGEGVGIRSDSTWNVPEPELGLVVNAGGSVVGLTIGNDVSSRSIEGENPLYLPQAKIYDRSCAIGPCLVPLDEAPPISELEISLIIRRGKEVVFKGVGSLSQLKRTPEELVRWLFAARSFPAGTILLCGTSTIPPPEFTLRAGDVVTIDVPHVGTLTNRTVLVSVDATDVPSVKP